MKPRRHGRKSVRLSLTQRAIRDLQGIESYSVSQWGRKVADKYLDGFQAALDRLVEQPDLLRSDPEVSGRLSFVRVQQHYLVCTCVADEILVLTAIHTSMDLPARLVELEPTLLAEAQCLRDRMGNH